MTNKKSELKCGIMYVLVNCFQKEPDHCIVLGTGKTKVESIVNAQLSKNVDPELSYSDITKMNWIYEFKKVLSPTEAFNEYVRNLVEDLQESSIKDHQDIFEEYLEDISDDYETYTAFLQIGTDLGLVF